MIDQTIDTAKYHLNVSLLGNGFLRYERLRSELKMRKPGFFKSDHVSPPLRVSPRLKELISRHYLKGRHANLNQKVAWVTSGAPVEFLIALGYFVHYPENHAAVCGIRRVTEKISGHAENEGYSQDICSYARTDFGTVLSGETPVGNLPRPDLLVCCNNICQTVLYWYQVLAKEFDVPLIVIDTPFLYGEAPEHAIDYVKAQLEEAVVVAERVAQKKLAFADLKRVSQLSKDAIVLWSQVIARGRFRPAPITAFDEFIHMAPIVEMRGKAFTVDYYRALLAELDQRIDRGVGAVKTERKRLIWDNLPIWFRVRRLSEYLAKHGVSLVASTYTNAWGELAEIIDPQRPIASAARAYTHAILNRSTGHKLRTMQKMVAEYHADGVVLHSDRSCKPYSIGQVDQREQLAKSFGVPALLLEADHSDPRAFADEQAENRLSAFFEMIGIEV